MSAKLETARPSASTEAERFADAPRLPANRSFVVQLSADAGLTQISGRAEHVASGKSTRFTSADELLSFLVQPSPAE